MAETTGERLFTLTHRQEAEMLVGDPDKAPWPDPDGGLTRYGTAIRKTVVLHAPDGQETPFCVECGHVYPCNTIGTLAAELGGPAVVGVSTHD